MQEKKLSRTSSAKPQAPTVNPFGRFIDSVSVPEFLNSREFCKNGKVENCSGGLFTISERVLERTDISTDSRIIFENTYLVHKIISNLARQRGLTSIYIPMQCFSAIEYASASQNIKEYMISNVDKINGELSKFCFLSLSSRSLSNSERLFFSVLLSELFVLYRLFEIPEAKVEMSTGAGSGMGDKKYGVGAPATSISSRTPPIPQPINNMTSLTDSCTTINGHKKLDVLIKGLKKKRTLIAIAAVLILILVWCCAHHFGGIKSYENGELSKAVSQLSADFLFSSRVRKQAISDYADELYSNQEYLEAAAQYAKLGANGKNYQINAILKQAKLYIGAGEYDEALALLAQVSSEKRAKEQIGVAKLAIARQQMESGDFASAQETADSIEDSTLVKLDIFYEELNYRRALDLLRNGDLNAAGDFFAKAKEYSYAEECAKAIKYINSGNYRAAAEVAATIERKDEDGARIALDTVIRNRIGTLNYSNIDVRLSQQFVLSVLDNSSPDYHDEAIKKTIARIIDIYESQGTMTYSLRNSDSCFKIDDQKQLLQQCGAADAGKILILRSHHPYEVDLCYAVDFALMNFLPSGLYPSSLAEVSYIVTLAYDYDVDGYYSSTYYAGTDDTRTVGLQENAYIKVESMPRGSRLYSSYTIWGNSSPQSFQTYGSVPKTKSGGAPPPSDVADAFCEAIKVILDR